MSDSDRLLYLSVKESFDAQSFLFSYLIHSPMCPLMLVIGFLFCGDSVRKYDAAKLDQGHRFNECICCNIIVSFTMSFDDKFVYPVNGAKFSAMAPTVVMINPMATAPSSPAPGVSQGQLNAKEVVRMARVEKLIKEGRISEAEMVANA
jgi:hypothetical protein